MTRILRSSNRLQKAFLPIFRRYHYYSLCKNFSPNLQGVSLLVSSLIFVRFTVASATRRRESRRRTADKVQVVVIRIRSLSQIKWISKRFYFEGKLSGRLENKQSSNQGRKSYDLCAIFGDTSLEHTQKHIKEPAADRWVHKKQAIICRSYSDIVPEFRRRGNA